MKKILLVPVLVVVFLGVGVWYWSERENEPVPALPVTEETYRDEILGLSITLPTSLAQTTDETHYSVDRSYSYTALGPQNTIAGVKFTIPSSFATGTNLSRDSYISVEHLSDAQACTAETFLGMQGGQAEILQEGVLSYSFASTAEAGAGNRYDEYIYARQNTSPCVAVRYFIHSSAIENYEPGTVTAFDKAALLAKFDAIRKTLVVDRWRTAATTLTADVYPLYSGLAWQDAAEGISFGMTGDSIQSFPVSNVTDIAAITRPFEAYYADKLRAAGWSIDNSKAAGGPGSAVTAYKRGSAYIIVQYTSDFSVKNIREPEQCPCTVQFSVFSGLYD